MAAVQDWHRRESARVLRRLGPALAQRAGDPRRAALLAARLDEHLPRLLAALHELYGWSYDFHWHLERVLELVADSVRGRADDLLAVDAGRAQDGDDLLGNGELGGVCYVDRLGGDLAGIGVRIPELRELGITYLHLMPLFRVPDGESDGGYAVSDYRGVDPRLGSVDDLRRLATALRAEGIRLVLDFVLNHTADDHAWARAAQAGDEDFQAFYWMFDDRHEPERYLPTLRAIFPDRGGDAFTWRADVAGPNGGKWVWTTFHTYQWDLNYRNPAVFTAVAGELLFLANLGVDVLRLDAVPFLWKEPGTSCENRPAAHVVVQALNAVAAIAAPALAFKSEAIVHPDEVVRWVGADECRLSYNPLLMALLWESLATGETVMLADALARRHALPAHTSWANYLRGHDDIGWGFADEDAERLGIDPAGHRAFLNAFYTGRHPGSFARGLPFQENPATGDCRICGTLASLAGLEQAVESGDEVAVDRAVQRILMLHGVVLTAGGIPLLYLGDEVAQLNDYGYRDVPGEAADARWVHRPRYPDARLARARADATSPEGRVRDGLLRLIALRRSTPALAGNDLAVVDLGTPAAVAFRRTSGGERAVVVASFSPRPVDVPTAALRLALAAEAATDRVSGAALPTARTLRLEPYALLVLVPQG